ncbi:MAG: M48 family metalloprotease [Microcystaceae cyanobacterium]
MVANAYNSLKTAISAYNEKNYSTAITELETLCQSSEDELIRIQATKRLVKAYAKVGKITEAIALCQDLLVHPIYQRWAKKSIRKLQSDEPLGRDDPDFSGFIDKARQRMANLALRPPYQWRNAGRSEVIKPLRRPSPFRLGWVLLATLITLIWLISQMIQGIFGLSNSLVAKVNSLFPFLPSFYLSSISLPYLLSILLIFVVISPYLLDGLLKQAYCLQSLSLEQLEVYSPETVEILGQFKQKKRIKALKLGILSLDIPLILSYGHFPRNARIIVSRGLLKQLENDEIATLYATQLGQMSQWDFPWISGMMGLLQLPYSLYWQLITFGRKKLPSQLAFLSVGLAMIFYGIYRLWRIPTLWLSRQRVYYSDHFAVNLTGNPNGLSRGLVKIAQGMAYILQKQHYTPWLLDGLDSLLPVEPRQVLTLGSLPPDTALEPILRWDCENSFRHWLVLTNSHPLLGERIYLLSRHAQFYNLPSEFDLTHRRPSLQHKGEFFWKLINCYQALPIWQSSIIFAFGGGIALRCLFWVIGRLSEQMQVHALTWLYNAHPFLNAWVMWVIIMAVVTIIFLISERFPHIFAYAVLLRSILWLGGQSIPNHLSWLQSIDPFFNAWVAIALSMSLIMRMNRYFPSLKASSLEENPSLPELLSDIKAVPSDSIGVQINGTLLGRKGMGNWLGQDLFLHTSDGLIQLRYTPWGGFFSLILPWVNHPCNWVNQSVTVRGWLRRGSTPWIDIDKLDKEYSFPLKGHYPIWLTMVAIAFTLWGTYLILKI